MSDLHRQVERFLFREAWLADSHSYAEWLTLWAEDCTYWLPCNEDDADPATHIALIYDRYRNIEDRVRRLSGEFAHSQQPRSRLSRLIGNILIDESEDGLIDVRSTFNLTAFRRDRIETFAGRVVHRLQPSAEGDFRIAAKTVYLVNNDGYIGNMTFLI